MSLADHMAVSIKNGANSVDSTYVSFGGGNPTSVRGRFLRPPAVVQGMEANGVEFHCMLADVPTPRHDDRYEIDGVRYRVKAVHKDPVGGIVENELELIP